jgi:hypothetical protein
MSTYQIITTDGGILANNVAERDVASRAQELANERGEAVTYYATPVSTDDDGEGTDDGVTVEPITDAEITKAMAGFEAGGDAGAVELCERALAGNGEARAKAADLIAYSAGNMRK